MGFKRKKNWGEWESVPKMAWPGEMERALPQINEVLKNNVYLVYVSDFDAPGIGSMTHLWIHRTDRKPRHSWTDFQRIKNEVCGEDRIAVEVYPDAKSLVDQAHWYHLWVYPEGCSLPFGLHIGGQ